MVSTAPVQGKCVFTKRRSRCAEHPVPLCAFELLVSRCALVIANVLRRTLQRAFDFSKQFDFIARLMVVHFLAVYIGSAACSEA